MSLTNPTLSPSRAREQIARILRAGLVPVVRSSPGIGKSEIGYSLADEYNLLVMDFRAGQADITDFNGLPSFVEYRREDGTLDRRAEFVPFTDFPLEGDELPIKHDRDGKVLYEADGVTPQRYDGWLLFFDELTSAPKQIQAAAYKILLDKKVGQRRLHKKVMMMAAGNLDTDMAVTHSMSTALQSRLIHLEMRVDHRDWMSWATANGVDSRILGYIAFRPEKLHEFAPDHQDKTFACPRTWWFAHRLIDGQPITLANDLATLAGTLSVGVAHEFIGFCEIYADLPAMSDVIRDPMGTPVPAEPSIKYAMATSIADQLDANNVAPLIQYLNRLPVECRVLCMRMVSQRKPQLLRLQPIADLFGRIITMM
jgi:hypothetical protein